MTFLNLILLGGAAAFAIPLIIHLLNRRRLQVVEWGAMHLLENVLRKNNQRMKIEQLLLLLIRIALPIILALLMARPVLTGMQRFLGDQQTSTVILVDDTFTMQTGDAAGTRFDRAREEIRQILAELPRGSDATVVLMGSGGRALLDEPTVVLDSLPAHLREHQPLGHSIDVADSLRKADGEFGRMQHAARELIVVSGFQAGVWDREGGGRAAALASLTDSPTPPAITLLPVGAGGTDNISIGPVSVSAIILGVNQRFSIRVEVTNHGSSTQTDVPVHFSVDGRRLQTSRVSLAPNQVTQVLFNHSFDEPGDQHVLLATEGDALPGDNEFHIVLPVWDEVPVVLVNGAPGQRPLEGETDFLEIALQPLRSTDPSLNDLIRSQVVLANQVNRELMQEQARVVVLANVERLNDRQLEDLENFVSQGGGLIVFPGDRIDRDWYDRSLYREGSGLLPVRIGAMGEPRARSADVSGAARIAERTSTHPALEYFNDPRNGRLTDALFSRWFQLEEPVDDESAAGIDVFARLDTGDPLLVEHAFGRGRVVLAALPADNAWGNLPTQPVYVPLMQRLVTHVASESAAPVNLLTGTPLRAVYPEAVAGQTVVVIDAEGREHVVEARAVDNRAVVEFSDTRVPGLYRVLPPAVEGPEPLPEKRFAFNLSRLESDLTPLSDSQLDALADEMGAVVVRSAADHSLLDRARRFGQEIWKPLLWTLLVLLFAEILLQQWMARRRVATA